MSSDWFKRFGPLGSGCPEPIRKLCKLVMKLSCHWSTKTGPGGSTGPHGSLDPFSIRLSYLTEAHANSIIVNNEGRHRGEVRVRVRVRD